VTDYLSRARSALDQWLHGRRRAADSPPAASAPSPGAAADSARTEDTVAAPERPEQLLPLLAPRPGLGRTLRRFRDTGVLESLLNVRVDDHALAAIEQLDQLLAERSLSGERFG
jgi:hypothetical protein